MTKKSLISLLGKNLDRRVAHELTMGGIGSVRSSRFMDAMVGILDIELRALAGENFSSLWDPTLEEKGRFICERIDRVVKELDKFRRSF